MFTRKFYGNTLQIHLFNLLTPFVIHRHSFRYPVWLIQIKLDAFSQQVLLHELSAASISPAHTYFSSPDFHISRGSKIMSFSKVDPLFPKWTWLLPVAICLQVTSQEQKSRLLIWMWTFFSYLKLLHRPFPFLMKAIILNEQAYAKMFKSQAKKIFFFLNQLLFMCFYLFG